MKNNNMKIILSSKAKFDLKTIYNYISKDNKIVAKQQIDKIYNAIELIAKNPYMGVNGRAEHTREFFIPYTNYFIVYGININVINIVNIIHTSKNYNS